MFTSVSDFLSTKYPKFPCTLKDYLNLNVAGTQMFSDVQIVIYGEAY